MMEEGVPVIKLSEWRGLYEATMLFQQAAPWKWMVETDLLGVKDPENDRIGFASVMGEIGKHQALAVYLGSEGLFGFLKTQADSSPSGSEVLFEIPQLQVSFEDRAFLLKQDMTIIKRLSLKFLGRNAWPLFRSWRAGFLPWFLEREEVRFLTIALEQSLDVALRFKEDLSLLKPQGEFRHLVRVSREGGKGIEWEDEILTVPPPEPARILIEMDSGILGELGQFPQSDIVLETDFFMSPSPISEPGKRPFLPYILLMVEASSGFVVGFRLLDARISLESMWGSIPSAIVQLLAEKGLLPRTLAVRSPMLLGLLGSLASALPVDVKHVPSLPSLDEAKEEMLKHFLGGGGMIH